MRDKIRLVALREPAKARDQRERHGPAKAVEIEIQIVKGREDVRGVQAWKDRVLQVPRLTLIRICEITSVAVET